MRHAIMAAAICAAVVPATEAGEMGWLVRERKSFFRRTRTFEVVEAELQESGQLRILEKRATDRNDLEDWDYFIPSVARYSIEESCKATVRQEPLTMSIPVRQTIIPQNNMIFRATPQYQYEVPAQPRTCAPYRSQPFPIEPQVRSDCGQARNDCGYGNGRAYGAPPERLDWEAIEQRLDMLERRRMSTQPGDDATPVLPPADDVESQSMRWPASSIYPSSMTRRLFK